MLTKKTKKASKKQKNDDVVLDIHDENNDKDYVAIDINDNEKDGNESDAYLTR